MAIAFLDLAASIPTKASVYSTMACPPCAEDRLGPPEQPSSRIVGRATSSAAERTYGHPLYLASEQMSGYVTEQMIEVNGGQYMPCQELRALLSDPGWLWVPDICAGTARCATSCARSRTIRDP